MKNEDFKGKEYQFKLGVIDAEMVEECRALLKTNCQNLVEDEEISTNTIAYLVGTEKEEVSDAMLFQSAISHYKIYLTKQIEERNKHIVMVQKPNY